MAPVREEATGDEGGHLAEPLGVPDRVGSVDDVGAALDGGVVAALVQGQVHRAVRSGRLAEIGGAWPVWQGLRGQLGLLWIAGGDTCPKRR